MAAALTTLETGDVEECLMLYQNCLVLYPMRITEHLSLKTFTLEICTSLKLMVSSVYLLVFLTFSFFSPCCADNDEQQDTEEGNKTQFWVALAVTQSYRPKRKVPRSSISIPDLERCLAKASFSASQKSGIYRKRKLLHCLLWRNCSQRA